MPYILYYRWLEGNFYNLVLELKVQQFHSLKNEDCIQSIILIIVGLLIHKDLFRQENVACVCPGAPARENYYTYMSCMISQLFFPNPLLPIILQFCTCRMNSTPPRLNRFNPWIKPNWTFSKFKFHNCKNCLNFYQDNFLSVSSFSFLI